MAGYQIEGLAGTGGMGVVYRAQDIALSRTVALKLILSDRADDPRQRELFVREALVAARLEHPHIVPIYAAGEDEGRLFIAMRFIEGPSLSQLITANGSLAPARAARIISQVGAALDVAHSKGLVHRDVKPANILVSSPGPSEHVYLSDFGLSMPELHPSGRGGGAMAWAGTLDYVAPEQIRGADLDARADVYALGCVLFHALTGRAPFAAASETETLIGHLTAPAPLLSEVMPGLPRALDEVLARALAKEPTDRYASAGELGAAALAARHEVALTYEERDDAAARGLARSLSASGLEITLVRSERAADAIRAARACALLVGAGGLQGLGAPALEAAEEMVDAERGFASVLAYLPGSAEEDGNPAVPSFFHTWVDLRADSDDPVALDHLAAALRGRRPRRTRPESESGTGPYRGLLAFDEADAGFFFGREDETQRLLERLESGFIAVVGSSGAGKSSLVRAGLVPALRAQAPERRWRIEIFTPGAHPARALSEAIGRLGDIEPPAGVGDDGALTSFVMRVLSLADDSAPMLLVVDQLEEMYTLCPNPGERQSFSHALVAAAALEGPSAVVITMRADLYPRLVENEGLAGLVSENQILLGPLRGINLRRAITEPARLAGADLQPGLVPRILSDVDERPGSLALVEHLLLELWRRRQGNTLTLEAYGASGGVEGALARRAEQVYQALDDDQQLIARRILLRLVVAGEGDQVTRRRGRLGELVQRPEEQGDVEAVLGALVEARLLTTSSDDEKAEPVADVAHEALMSGWPRLRSWIDEDRDHLRLRRRLTEAAADWDQSERDQNLLYRGSRLAAWVERGQDDLSPLESDFLDASQRQARRQARQRRGRLIMGFAALAAVTVAVGLLAAFALVSRNDAASQRDAAVSREIAGKASSQLPLQPELAILLARQAYDTSPTAEAEEVLRAAVHESKVRDALEPTGAVAMDVAYFPDDERLAAVSREGLLRIWTPGEDQVKEIPTGQAETWTVAISPDGQTIATGGSGGQIGIWGADGEPKDLLQAGKGIVDSLVFTPDGSRLLSAGEDGAVRVWRLDGSAPVALRGYNGVWLTAMDISADGSAFAADGFGGSLRIRDLEGGELARELTNLGSDLVEEMSFSPDGTLLATASGDQTLRIWNLEDASPRPSAVRSTAPAGISSLSWSRDSSTMAAAGSDGAIRILDRSGKTITTLRGHAGAVQAVAFSPDADRLASAGQDGWVRIWDWDAGLPLAQADRVSRQNYDLDGIRFEPTGKGLLGVSDDGSLLRWDLTSTTPDVIHQSDRGEGFSSSISGDGRLYASNIVGPEIYLRGTAPADSERDPLKVPKGLTWAMSLDRTGKRMASVGSAGNLRIWDLSDGTSRAVDERSGNESTVDISPDGSRIITSDAAGPILVWDADRGEVISTLSGQEGLISEINISPDGRRVLSGSFDRQVRLWDARGGSPQLLEGHSGVALADFSDDGSRIITASSTGAQVWDTETARLLLKIPAPDRDGDKSILSPDGHLVAMKHLDGRIDLYACDTCGTIAEVQELADQRLTRTLTEQERQLYLAD